MTGRIRTATWTQEESRDDDEEGIVASLFDPCGVVAAEADEAKEVLTVRAFVGVIRWGDGDNDDGASELECPFIVKFVVVRGIDSVVDKVLKDVANPHPEEYFKKDRTFLDEPPR